MAQTKDERRAAIAAAVKKSQQKTDAIMLRPPLANGQKIRDAAKASGETLSGYILGAVNEYMARHPGNGSAQAAANTSADCVVEISEEMYTKAKLSANYHKMSIREFVEMSIAEQRMRDLKGVRASVETGKK